MQAKGRYLKRLCMCICTMGQQAVDTVDSGPRYCPMQGCPVLNWCSILSHVCCQILITYVLKQASRHGYNEFVLNRLKDFVQADKTYTPISGLKVSTVKQKGLNNNYMISCCSLMQWSASLQQVYNCRLP